MRSKLLELILIPVVAGTLSACATTSPRTTQPPYRTSAGISGIIDNYLQTLSNDGESELLRTVYNNPFQAESIETAMKDGIDPAKVYLAIEYGLVNERERLTIKWDEMYRSGADLSSDQFQNTIVGILRIGHLITDVTDRDIGKAGTNPISKPDVEWYLESTGNNMEWYIASTGNKTN